MPPQDQGDVNKDQSNVVLRVLRQLDKVLTAEDKPLAAAYVKAKAWDLGKGQMSTEDLRRAFAKRMGLRILLDVNQLKRAIRDGAQHGIWVYYNPEEQVGYGPPSPAPLVQISDETLLYASDEAKRLNIPVKGEVVAPPEEMCPVCGMPTSRCICDAGPLQPPTRLHAEGAPAQVFQAILDQ
jgi:hypothetical protein